MPERTINIKGRSEPAFSEPAAPDQIDSVAAAAGPAVTVHSDFWRRVSEILAALLLVTLFSWWWSSRPKRAPRDPEPVPLHKQQAKFLKQARKAAVATDGVGVRAAMISWALLQWPADTPRSIGVIASRVSSPLAEELRALSRLSYGPEKANWDGAALARALRSFAVLEEQDDADQDVLPPLMPPTTAPS